MHSNIDSAMVEWDFKADSVFDTVPTTTKILAKVFDAPGNYRITARLTDALGAVSVSAPIVLQVAPLPGAYNQDLVVDAADYVAWRKVGSLPDNYDTWRSHFGEPAGNGSDANANATIPEPATIALLLFSSAAWCFRRDRAA